MSAVEKDLEKASLGMLARSELTYPEVGATARRPLPSGYRHADLRVLLGRGERVFQAAGEALISWEVHRRAGLGVVSRSPTARRGAVVVLRAGVGPLRVLAPCRVVYVIEGGRRRGFAYGTLPGHPATGEEAFVVERHEDDAVSLRITAFSRPRAWYARLGGPLTTIFQNLATRRYAAAARAVAADRHHAEDGPGGFRTI